MMKVAVGIVHKYHCYQLHKNVSNILVSVA